MERRALPRMILPTEKISNQLTMELTVSGAGSSGGGGLNRLGLTRPESSVVADPRTFVSVSHCENGIP